MRSATVGPRPRHHGNFDGGCVTIASYLARRFGIAPWRFGEPDYRRAVRALDVPRSALDVSDRASAAPDCPSAGGRLSATDRARAPDCAFATPWDSGLGVAMGELGVRVEEEHVLEDLLADLADRS